MHPVPPPSAELGSTTHAPSQHRDSIQPFCLAHDAGASSKTATNFYPRSIHAAGLGAVLWHHPPSLPAEAEVKKTPQHGTAGASSGQESNHSQVTPVRKGACGWGRVTPCFGLGPQPKRILGSPTTPGLRAQQHFNVRLQAEETKQFKDLHRH